MSVQATSGSIVEQFQNNTDVDVDPETVRERVTTFVDEYQVPEEEARRSVTNQLLDEHDIDQNTFYASESGNDLVGVGDINAAEQWVDLKAEVDQLWEPRSDSIAQVGLLADDTGRIKFTSWAKSDLPELEEGQSYSIQNVVSDEYQGQFSVKLNRTTDIEALDEDIETDFGTESITSEGALVAIQPGSGLIKRCPDDDCTRVIQEGRCSEHGQVEGEFDMRIKGVLDDGQEARAVIFNQEMTEAVSELDLDEATEMAMDALDLEVVADELRERLIGHYYEIDGPVVGEYHLVDEFAEIGPNDAVEADAAHVLDERFDADML